MGLNEKTGILGDRVRAVQAMQAKHPGFLA